MKSGVIYELTRESNGATFFTLVHLYEIENAFGQSLQGEQYHQHFKKYYRQKCIAKSMIWKRQMALGNKERKAFFNGCPSKFGRTSKIKKGENIVKVHLRLI